MRIAHVLPLVSSRFGGPVVFAADAAEALQNLGHDVTVFSTNLGKVPSSGDSREIRADEMPQNANVIDLELFDVGTPQRLVYSKDLAKRLNAVIGEFDIVHIHSLWLHAQYAAQHAARRAQVPYVVSPHGALDPYLRQRGKARKALTSLAWQNRMLSNASALHITTTEEGELIEDIAPAVRRALVPNGIWVSRFDKSVGDGARFRDNHLDGFDGPLVTFLGRVTFKKGVDVLIRSFEHVIASTPGSKLAIVGPDDEGLTPQLIALVDELGLSDQIVFTGALYGQDRADALAATDVWALSSHTENFGIAVVEALAAGLATVISPAVNLADGIEQANAGLVADLDPREFGDAVARLLSDTTLRAEIETNAVTYAQQFDWSVIGPQLAQLYADCLN